MDKNNEVLKLKHKTVDALRDLALDLEAEELEVSEQLMALALQARPSGSFIKSKLEGYRETLHSAVFKKELAQLVESGELAIIPVGFRCETKIQLSKKLGIDQPSLPFDSGFFPPASVVSIFKNPKIDLSFESNNVNHAVCIKHEGFNNPTYGSGIKFKTSTYDGINKRVILRGDKPKNNFLDSTGGYYTFDMTHNFVLAHYNWHEAADPAKSGGIVDPRVNLKNINNILNGRIDRMFEMCSAAKQILFVQGEFQEFNHMMVDDDAYDLNEMSVIQETVTELFGAKSLVVRFSEIDSAEKALELLKSNRVKSIT